MIDLGYPAVPVELAIGDASRGDPLAPADGAVSCSPGLVAHQVVAAALANHEYARAERAARVACELLPNDERALLDLARVLAARGHLEQARALLQSFANTRSAGGGRGRKAGIRVGDIGRKRRRIEVLPEREPAEAPAGAPERTPAPEQPAKTPAPAAP